MPGVCMKPRKARGIGVEKARETVVGSEVREVTITWKTCRLVGGLWFYSKIENCWRFLGRGVTR